MDDTCLTSYEELPPPTGKGATRPAAVTPLRGSMPHALMYDLTHDNESPLHKRSAEDALSTGALVTFGWCATGSNKGFDDLYPKLLDLVGDNRRYETSDSGKVDRGISGVKKVLNQLHTEMVLGGFSEGHVHQEGDVSSDTIPLCIHLTFLPTVHRHPSRAAPHPERLLPRRAHRFPRFERLQSPW